MLVLTRKIGEGIDILNGTIQIKVVQVKGKQVRFGLTCPDNVDIHRSESTPEERKELGEKRCKTNKNPQ